MLIHKQVLPMDTLDIRKVELPFRSAIEAAQHVLKVEKQGPAGCMWYQADLNGQDEDINREFVIIAIGTGHDWPETLTKDNYIGTLLFYHDSLVLHYFIVECEKELDDGE